MILNDRQIKYGVNYNHEDDIRPKMIVEVKDFKGEDSLVIRCTQLGDANTPNYKTAKDKKRVVNEWCKFLKDNPEQFTHLEFPTKINQQLFNAICSQKNLTKLNISWGNYKDLANIVNLEKLEYLYIGGGASVESIEPLAKLQNLVALSIENFQKVDDYSVLYSLPKLESLELEGDGLSSKYIRIKSLNFLKEMTKLRFFYLVNARIIDKDYTPICSLENIEHLTLSATREVKKLYEEIIKLPKLKYGLVVDKPELYKR